ncbi:MAG TPA: recombinase RecT, partial [Chitinophagaceae bacterium]|nr:recombinase RecT [Chitinophagaceae bacterium]
MDNKLTIVQQIEQTTHAQLANIPEVGNRFKNIYLTMNGGDNAIATNKYEAEKFHFMKLIQDKPDLQQCTKLSLYGCFMDMAVNGLSFDPAMKHAYVVSFNTNVGTKEHPKWEKRATLMISGYGELHMRVRQKQIKYADNPILVYEGDEFRHGTKDSKVFLEHVAAYPRKTDNIIACYIRLERHDGSSDYKVLSIEEVMKLKKFSKDPNSKAWIDG